MKNYIQTLRNTKYILLENWDAFATFLSTYYLASDKNGLPILGFMSALFFSLLGEYSSNKLRGYEAKNEQTALRILKNVFSAYSASNLTNQPELSYSLAMSATIMEITNKIFESFQEKIKKLY
ncbi:MAG: hypothetical protein QXL86_00435 [Candidatus Aenigmatarchaeota archaeon]